MAGDTDLKPIVFEPGIRKDVTEYMAEGGWVDCDKIRFRNGRPEKIGGWVSETIVQSELKNMGNSFSSAFSSAFQQRGAFSSAFSSAFTTDDLEENYKFTGIPRAALSWNDLDFKKYLCVASNLKLELMYGNIIYDITPVRETVALNNAISTTSGDSIVTISDTTHGLVADDYIYVNSQASAVAGITLTGQYQVVEVIDANSYTIDATYDADSTVSNAGGALNISYLLENGAESNGSLTGWGGSTWGTPGEGGGGWDRPRAGAAGSLHLRQWSLDNWGEDLIACMRNGKIYHWDATSGPTTRAIVLSNAPEENLFVLVSQPSRHIIAFGSEVHGTSTFDPLIIRWAESESLTGWTITDTNTAGEYRLSKGNYIVGACQTRSEIVVFTDTDVYSMRYVGGNEVFRIEPLGTNISVISQHAFVDVNGIVYWQGNDNFYMYDGVVRVLPSTLNKYIFDQDGEGRINFNQKEKSYIAVNKEFNEIIFLYPRYDSNENNVYAKYNYLERVFDFGELDRTVWLDKGTFSKPYALDTEGYLYVHETGKDADGRPLEAFIRSAYFDLGEGQDFMFLDRIVPDIKLADNRNILITLYVKKYVHPQATIVTKGPYTFDDTDNQIAARARGRQMSIEYRVTSTGSDFEVGKVRIGVQPDGQR